MNVKKVTDYNLDSCSEEALRELINESKNKYWKKALWESSNELLKNKKTPFENKRKGYFYAVTSSYNKRKALDLNANTGIISHVVSDFFKEVIAYEYNPLLIEFMRLRFKQDKKDNIKLVRGNKLYLPFKNNTFDLIILNGGLATIPHFNSKGNPKETQINFLKECMQKISLYGQLIIGIENRVHFNYLLGGTPNGDIPFTTILPRPLANLITRIATKKKYLAYLYSFFGYKQILKKAGFKNIEIYIVIPDYYNPMIILPIRNNSIINKVITSSGSLPKNKIKKIIYIFLLKIGILKYLMHSFYIIGEKT